MGCDSVERDSEYNGVLKEKDMKQFISGIIILVIIVCFFNFYNGSTSSDGDPNEVKGTAPDKIVFPERSKEDVIRVKKYSDSIAKVEAIEKLKEDAKYGKTKAGKIYRKHPDWSKEDCERIAKNMIWIGMNYDMLVCERGKPNSIHTSNYGSGNEYQCCWEDYQTSCFYMKKE